MKLYLIRHAQSANNAVYTGIGSHEGRVPDPDITDIGHQQAARLAQRLADDSAEPYQHPTGEQRGFGITHLYCSLMARTILTANYVAERLGLKLTALDHTFERGGIYEVGADGIPVGLPGPTRHDFTKRFPNLILPESVGETGWYGRPFETDEVFIERVKRATPDIINRHVGTEDRVALVAHGDFIDQFVNELMGVERQPKNYRGGWEGNWAFNNTSISRIDLVAGSATVVYLNRIDHLAAELVTW